MITETLTFQRYVADETEAVRRIGCFKSESVEGKKHAELQITQPASPIQIVDQSIIVILRLRKSPWESGLWQVFRRVLEEP